MKDNGIYLDHILQSIKRILDYISNLEYSGFNDDTKTQDAVVRQLEIIGEATKRLSKEFRIEHPDIPWSDLAGMRDVLIHDYLDVDLDIVWKTASEDIPQLKILLEKIEK